MNSSLSDALRFALSGLLASLLGCAPDYDSSTVEAPPRAAPKESVPSASARVMASTLASNCAELREWLLVTRDEVEQTPSSVNWKVPREALDYPTPAIQALASRNAALVNALAERSDGGAPDDPLARATARALFDDSVSACHFEPIAIEDARDREPYPASDGGVAEKRFHGRLAPELIQHEVRAHFESLRHCYERGLSRDPKLQGTVATKFVIKRDGTVSHVEDGGNGGSTLPSRRVLACVRDTFRKLVFPAPEGGIVTVVYPIIFNPGD